MARTKSKQVDTAESTPPMVDAATALGDNVVDVEVVDVPVEEQPVAEQPVEEQPVAEQPVEEQPAAQPVQTVRSPRTDTKSHQVRVKIAEVKAAQPELGEAEQKKQVVDWTVEHLGMARGLARVYVKNNWAKA